MKALFCSLLIMLCSVAAFGTDYYVDPDDGSDAAAGTSAGTAWATLKKASLNVNDGDRVFIEGPSGYVYSAQSDANDCILFLNDNGGGAANQEIQFIGCSDINDVNDGGVITLNADTSGLANCVKGTCDYYVFKNFYCIGGTGDAWNIGTENYVSLINCRASNSDADGFDVGAYCILTNCVADENGESGFETSSHTIMTNCISWRNTSYGIDCSYGPIIGCLSADNGDDQILVANTLDRTVIYDCIVDGNNTKVGIDDNASVQLPTVIMNCIIYDCSVGIEYLNGAHEKGGDRNNVFYSCATNISGTDVIRADPHGIFNTYSGNYVATADPFGSDPGTDSFQTLMSNYVIADAEYQAGAKKAAGDLKVTKDHWKDVDGGTNPAGNAEAPRGNKDLGGTQSTASATGAFSQNKSGNKS